MIRESDEREPPFIIRDAAMMVTMRQRARRAACLRRQQSRCLRRHAFEDGLIGLRASDSR